MKTKNILFEIILLAAVTAPFSFCQIENEVKLQLTGNLNFDSKILLNDYSLPEINPLADELSDKKSPLLSGLFSAVIPGAGQVYNGDYWIAGIFLALEAAVITTAVIYDNKGDDQTIFFQNYADDYDNPDHNWSVVRYAEWLAQYEGADLTKIIIPNSEGLPPWERVNWAELNAAETGSHNLPPHGEQQYYELIGKYHQYAAGWNDYTSGANNDLISSNFTYYSGLRGQANDYYNTASTAVVCIYINHILSAAEAIWGAARFNSNLAVNLRVENQNIAGGTELVPTLKLQYGF